MPAPKFTLALTGSAPNLLASKEQLEDGINAALQELSTQLDVKAEIANSGKMFTGRSVAVSAGQAALPNALGMIFTREGNYIAIRTPGSTADDPLFGTAPHWGVTMRVPAESLLTSAAEAAYRASLWQFEGEGAQQPLIVSEDGRVLLAADGAASAPVVSGIITDDGQSNAKGTAGTAASVVYGAAQSPRLLTLLRGTAADVWLGNVAIPSGTSTQLDGATITGIGPMQPQIASTGQHGTTAAEGAARWLDARTARGPLLIWNNAEGGQPIEELLPDAPAGNHAFANAVTAITRAAAIYGPGLVWRWHLMAQGEANTALATLGGAHDQYRRALADAAQGATGQIEPTRMISFQMSSFIASDGVRSILAYALEHKDDGLFFCGGPTYWLPFSGDLIHHSSLGHAMRGELCGAIIREVEQTGSWLPLHMTGATRTGANEITVTLSEAAAVETNSVVAAVDHLGMTMAGGTITSAIVSDDKIVLATSGAASGVTAVRAGLVGQANPATTARIPRTNIRSARGYGQHLAGGTIRKWLCHQEIAL